MTKDRSFISELREPSGSADYEKYDGYRSENGKLEEQMDSIITLTDEDGRDTQLELLDIVEYQDEKYVIFLPFPLEKLDDSPEVIILRLEETEDDSDEEVYVSVESEEILQAVFGIFREKFEKEFCFED